MSGATHICADVEPVRALAEIEGPIGAITYYGDGIWDREACAVLGWQFRSVGPALQGLTSFDEEIFP